MSELLTNQNFDSTHIILLYGQDNFGINEELKKIKNSLGKFGISPDDITTLDGLENDLSFLLMNVWQAPMLAEKQVIIVRRFENMVKGIKSTNKKLKEHLENYINNPTKSTLLILVIEDKTEGKADFNKKIFPYDSIIKLHISKEFPKIYPNKFSK
jgi:DNA polymerase III delta subunit